ncbi:TraX family protein [Lacrimispora sp. JR3]|uniref:TraX family protein n=1 Tax=Lacrimispora sinapis TaxID=3111456 RepID=UPI003748CEDA
MEETISARREGITGNTLKIIAMGTMFIDHIGVVFIENGILKHQAMDQTNLWMIMDLILRTIGRISFPIFCFLLVEGFLHTRDVKRYGARLFLFALISEIPFDLAMFGEWFHPEYQNVFFTLSLGLWVLSAYRNAYGDPLKQSFAIVAGCGASVFLKCDYNIIGIVMILMFYIFRENKKMQSLFVGAIAIFESLTCFGAAVLALFPIRMYNGKRGDKSLKYFFYAFYPAHLILFYLLYQLFGK